MTHSIGMLSDNEAKVYLAVVEDARAGRPWRGHEAMTAELDCSSLSTVPTILKRLDQRYGLIRVESFQRGVRLTDLRNGTSTATPSGTTPHWRHRPRNIPAPAPASLRVRAPDVSTAIAAWAARRQVPLAEALADLVFVGWEVERGRGG